MLSFVRNENGMKRVPANTKHHSVTVYTEMIAAVTFCISQKSKAVVEAF